MKKNSGYIDVPLRQISDLQQIYSERGRFVALLLEVLLLGAVLNYFASVSFQLFNTQGALSSPWLWIQLLVSFALVIGILVVVTHIDILQPLGMRTMFYTGIMVKPGRGAEPPIVFAPPPEYEKLGVQHIVHETVSTYKAVPYQDESEMAEVLQFAILAWYHHKFADGWLHTPKLRALGNEQTIGIEGVEASIFDRPDKITNYETNSVLALRDQLLKANIPVWGMVGMLQLRVPSGVEIEISKEIHDVPHLEGKTRNCQILFRDPKVGYVKIVIAVSGLSILEGRQHLLPIVPAPVNELRQWYTYNYFISVRAEFKENWLSRLGIGPNKSALEHYYRWAREILEGLETDFCWPLSFQQQYVDWKT